MQEESPDQRLKRERQERLKGHEERIRRELLAQEKKERPESG